MGETRIPPSQTVIDIANGLARSWLEPLIREAVEDAVREAHHEEVQSSSSRRLPFTALLIMGAVIGGILVWRHRRDTDVEHRIETPPDTEESAASPSDEEEQPATAGSSS